MELFTKSLDEDAGIVRRDGWIDLPQQMGRVRLNSEYIADSETSIYMPGVKVPLPGSSTQDENVKAREEEVKDFSERSDEDEEMS
mgnify:CR=1 FL=1